LIPHGATKHAKPSSVRGFGIVDLHRRELVRPNWSIGVEWDHLPADGMTPLASMFAMLDGAAEKHHWEMVVDVANVALSARRGVLRLPRHLQIRSSKNYFG
jgi:hypothetical protein